MTGKIMAFGGKGGSGKTTLAALVLRELLRAGHTPVLAVDADPNATLGLALGAPVTGTVADLRDRMGEAALKVGEIPKDRLMGQWLEVILSEQKGFDLLTMGRPEGPKCYCYVNSLLRRYLSLLRGSYPFVLVDCEAGMEYLSRLTVDDVDTLVLVAEPSAVGVATAGRICALADSLPIRIRRRLLALNKVGATADVDGLVKSRPDLRSIAEVVKVPFAAEIAARWARGDALDETVDAESRAAIQQLVQQFLAPHSQAAATRKKEPIS